MTREEWYLHKVLDAIEYLTEFIDLVRDGNFDVRSLTDDQINTLYNYLIRLQSDTHLHNLKR